MINASKFVNSGSGIQIICSYRNVSVITVGKIFFSGAMRLLYFLVVLLAKHTQQHSNNFTACPSTEDFPVLFKIDDYYNCPEDHMFCTTKLKLVPQNYESSYWKRIQKWSSFPFHYNRTQIHRTWCIPPEYSDQKALKYFVTNQTKLELAQYNLSTEISSTNCMIRNADSSVNITPSFLIIGANFALVLLATLYDAFVATSQLNILEKVLLCFSVMNYKRIATKMLTNDDANRLKCMQGLRMVATTCVIVAHGLLNTTLKPIKNTEFVEELFETKVIYYILALSLVIIQLFFLMSSWLLVYQILTIHQKQGQFTIRQAAIIFIHRIARIWPTLAWMLFLTSNIFYKYANGPSGFEIYNVLYRSCQTRFWPTFLYVTNLFPNFDVCHFGMWSLTLDTQYYVLTILLLYVSLNYKLDLKKLVGGLMVICYLVNIVQMYINKIRLDDWVSLKMITNFNNFNEERLFYIYFGFWVNYGSSLMGALFGYMDFHTRNCEKPKPFEKYYPMICLTTMISSLVLPSIEHGILTNAFLIPAVKVIFSAGIGLTIYSLSRNIIKGFTKFFLENKFFSVLGNFCFGVYVTHFHWVFYRGTHSSTAVDLSVIKFLRTSVEDTIVCFVMGILITVLITLPSLYIEKLILPSVWSIKEPKNIDKSNKIKSN